MEINNVQQPEVVSFEVMFLLGNYLELVDKNAVNKHKVLRVDSMKGVLESKMEFVKVRAVPQLCLNLQM